MIRTIFGSGTKGTGRPKMWSQLVWNFNKLLVWARYRRFKNFRTMKRLTNIKQIVIITGLMTGRSLVKKHLCKISVHNENSNCRFCEKDQKQPTIYYVTFKQTNAEAKFIFGTKNAPESLSHLYISLCMVVLSCTLEWASSS